MQLIVDPQLLDSKFPDASPSKLKHIWLIAVVVNYSSGGGLELRTVPNMPSSVTFSVEVGNFINRTQIDDLETGSLVNLEAFYNGNLDELIATNLWGCRTPTVMNDFESLAILKEYASMDSL